MDREALRKLAASRRTIEEVAPQSRAIWRCDFCKKDFVREKALLSHRCSVKVKIDELRSPTGQAAYHHYCAWMQEQRHSVQSIEAFGESLNYSPFLKFAAWAKSTCLPNPQAFIRLMVETRTPPGLWAKDTTYSMYLRAYDASVSPTDQFLNGIDLLQDIANEAGVSVSDVFSVLKPTEVAALIEKRKLTHWLLLCSEKFLAYRRELPEDERNLVTLPLQVGAALVRREQEPELVKQLSAATKEIGL
jgi:hypothetical protein